MRKFIKVSLYIFILLWAFIFGSKIFFKDMIHSNDYGEINRREIKINFESQREGKNGTYVKLKVINNSRYVFLLSDAKLEFPNYNNEGDVDLILELNLYKPYEDENEEIMVDGIEKYGESYMTFLIPKGVSLDKSYFDLNAISVKYDGIYKVDIPILENKYLVIGNNSGNYQIENSKEKINIGK